MIIGYRTGNLLDGTRRHWQDTGPRPVAWSAWYPAQEDSPASVVSDQFFDLGEVAYNAPPDLTAPLPVVLLSHGTGGTVESLGWLARHLALSGYAVLGVNHHGNTGLEPYLAEGFLCWWERAIDLSFLLTSLTDKGVFAGQLDLARVAAVGFSLGGYTVFALSGARTSMETFRTWTQAEAPDMGGPVEFPDVAERVPELMASSEVFRQSWDRQGEDFTDGRIKAIAAIAPAPTVRAFIASSLESITLPVAMITGGADREAPKTQCADWLAELNPSFVNHDAGSLVRHFTFLGLPSDPGKGRQNPIFKDHATVDRSQIQSDTAKRITSHFGFALNG